MLAFRSVLDYIMLLSMVRLRPDVPYLSLLLLALAFGGALISPIILLMVLGFDGKYVWFLRR